MELTGSYIPYLIFKPGNHRISFLAEGRQHWKCQRLHAAQTAGPQFALGAAPYVKDMFGSHI